MGVGGRLRIGKLQPKLREVALKRRDLLPKKRNLGLLVCQIRLDNRREGGPQFGGQGRLLFHTRILPLARLPA